MKRKNSLSLQRFIAASGQRLLCCLLLLMLPGCLELANKPSPNRDELPQQLTVGTLSSPLSFQMRGEEPYGLDYDLATQFARFIDRPVQFRVYPTLHQLFAAMEAGELDLIAAGLSRTRKRADNWYFGPPLYRVRAQLLYRNGQPKPRSLADLDGRLVVTQGSSHAELLAAALADYPELQFEQTTDYDSDELAAMVASGELDYTINDSSQLAFNQRYLPELRAAFTLGEPQAVAWALPQRSDDPLFSALLDFWHQLRRSGQLVRLEEKYFGHIERFDYVDTRAFIRAARTTLPRYQPLFERYAGTLDWRKLAAVSYQESHWDPHARSPTGVRGLMMLTQSTAKRMGVQNRLDPEQSIRGGSAYLQQLITRLPTGISDDEAIWFALAAYNVGLGHLEDARVITQRQGFDPNSWRDVKRHLPLLRQRKFYERSRYGYARGDEAAHYVSNIRRYYETLQWLDRQASAPEAQPDPDHNLAP
ncbi:membrane-bound lytic murein transglycosylase MltF [Ferrimonas gelatinilytica]|uniref:Membrane-bound lytic murein transglycosylase F n=1 Tax=Ferrimonas gelatinilytica TaxID=1255257 RepID=A0ABP9SHH6_9GAMM